MTFSEWMDEVARLIKPRLYKPRLYPDEFAVMIENYWDGMSPQKQVDLLYERCRPR